MALQLQLVVDLLLWTVCKATWLLLSLHGLCISLGAFQLAHFIDWVELLLVIHHTTNVTMTKYRTSFSNLCISFWINLLLLVNLSSIHFGKLSRYVAISVNIRHLLLLLLSLCLCFSNLMCLACLNVLLHCHVWNYLSSWRQRHLSWSR